MQIEVSKNELSGALSALGKLVCRTAPVELFRSLRIEGKENKISSQTVGLEESITCTIPSVGAGEFRVVVNFDEFRTVVRYGSCKAVALVYEDERIGIVGDHREERTKRVNCKKWGLWALSQDGKRKTGVKYLPLILYR